NVTQIRVCLSREGTNACFSVSDNGVGIPKERLSTIFNGGLSGVSHNNFDMKKNMGIGLSVCYTIVKAHDGTMTAENLDSGGACFRFYLPLEEGINSEIEG
ncbi:MAG: ATP-binding protein, partial [Oscillibacter sp.]|nr:ATP-binding protein [Oscillibacter sp.]